MEEAMRESYVIALCPHVMQPMIMMGAMRSLDGPMSHLGRHDKGSKRRVNSILEHYWGASQTTCTTCPCNELKRVAVAAHVWLIKSLRTMSRNALKKVVTTAAACEEGRIEA
eukprot:scaffold67675_cov16-Tisochrysis_lutea.AAC.1